MNLFIAGYGDMRLDVAVPRQALTELASELPFFADAPVETWLAPSSSSVMAAVGPPASLVGGVHYASFEPARAAVFAGRPVWGGGQGAASGADALDPVTYHAPAAQWASRLEGRCAVVRADDAGLQVYTDPLGSYPLFEMQWSGARWFSNSGEALRLLGGGATLDEEALASVLAGGWSLGGDPVWRGVRRVPRGTVLTLDGSGRRSQELLPVEQIVALFGSGLDVTRAASELVELTASLASWPGRANVVTVTGGRDSRLVLAAALRAGFAFDALTGGAPGEPDVDIAAQLCATVGLRHGFLEADPHGDRLSDLQRAARITALASAGTATLADAGGFPLGPRDGPLPVWHSGQGGEIGRAYYGPGRGQVADHLYAHFVARRPGRTEIVSPEAARLVRDRIGAFVEQTRDAGAALTDVPDLFYLLERMACWAAPTHGVVELTRDTVSPLWSQTMLPHLLGLPVAERALDSFHLRLLRELAPELVDAPFQDGSTWPSRQSALRRRVQRAGTLSAKLAAELRRRRAGRRTATAAGPVGGAGSPANPFDSVVSTVREAAFSQPHHAAWSVLDRARVEGLLGRPAASLDEMSRYYVWRLASTFLGLPQR